MTPSIETAGVERRRLFDHDFTRWYLARSISIAGTAASAVALPLLVYRTSASPALTAAVVGLEALPYLLFGLFAGAAADRLRRKRMMIAADICCALLLVTVPVAAAFDALASWHVLLVAFGVGCGFCWFDAAAWGAFVRVVGRSRVTRANSVIWTTEIVLEIAAPAAAGLLAALADPSLVLAADAATYLASAVLLAGIRTPLDTGPTVARKLTAEIAEGLRYLWRTPVLRTLTAAGFGLNVGVGGVLGLLVVHADQALGLSSEDKRLGLLYAAGAVGALVAAVILPRVSRWAGQGLVSLGGLVLFVAAVVGLAGTSTFILALGVWWIWSVARLAVNANGITVRQLLTPDELQGRVNTTGRMLAWGGTPFGALLGGLSADAYGVRTAYLLLAVPAALSIVLVYASPVRGLRLAVD
ncbi:putative MFS family arabinose efflux permease [Asanoa ferruginea]|uniref:Putative MFS family arabinose efflux permease n=1 Tax=Asanoa ferruginea TaxID=53367 RepID=A0A3D9ZNM7_9ACTN|nr:MFS transporter [Asanoa ferruginea]REF98978.1 putative MFS family arabinose efflux permease [Asanoa ferruginea]GIF46340.1 MFS transporter [Asanoa ferruginea]